VLRLRVAINSVAINDASSTTVALAAVHTPSCSPSCTNIATDFPPAQNAPTVVEV
jgi:hypothetical protein